MSLLRSALANRALVRLEAGWAVAALGMWAFSILFALYAYYEHGPGGVAIAMLVRMLPAAVLARVWGRLVDRYSSRSVLVASAIARVLLIEASALVVSIEASFALLLVLAAGMEIAASGHRPARATLITQLARTPAELAAVNVSRVVDYSGFLAGALAAGILLSSGEIDAALAVTGACFVGVAALAWRLPAGAFARVQGGRSPVGADRAWLEPVAAAIGAVSRQRWLRLRVAVFATTAVVQSTLEVLLVVAALDLLGLGQSGVGWLRAAFAAGGLLGGAAAVVVLRRGRFAGALAAGMVLAGAPLAVVAAWPAMAPDLLLLALLGGGYAVLEAALLGLTHRLLSSESVNLVASVEEVVYPLARALGAGLGAWLVLGLGNKPALVAAGLILPALALAWIRPLTRAEGSAVVPNDAVERLGRLPVLAGLPRAAVETLALRATPQQFEAGQTIARTGEGFGCLHVIEAGTAQRDASGQQTSRLQAGDCFGHGALLRDEPPRETVRAVTPVSTLAISRADFLASVGAPVRGPAIDGDVAPAQVEVAAAAAP